MDRRIALPVIALVVAACASPAGSAPATPGAPSPAATPAGSPSPSVATATATPVPFPSPRASAVDVGGRSLLVECRGEGSPTVFFEAGMTGDTRQWQAVVPFVGRRTKACAYDRAFNGQSDPAPTPRTVDDAVTDLTKLLAATDETEPIVLVGFSWGGLIAQVFAAKHPESVAGLVLIEANHPREIEHAWAHMTPEQIEEDKAFLAEHPEGFDMLASYEIAKAAGPLPSVPLVVVTAGVAEEWPEGWDGAALDQLRAEEQRDLANSVPGGIQVIAERSTHQVPAQQPDVIIDAVERVLDGIS